MSIGNRDPKHHTYKHGASDKPEYRAWQTMRLRCLNPENPAFPRYGGRGITICDRWKDDFNAFFADVGPKPSPKHELDRRDNDKGYEPGNVRWVTRSENDRNRRNNRWLQYKGQRRLMIELCEERGLDVETIRKRILAGWDDERAIDTPIRPKRPSARELRLRGASA